MSSFTILICLMASIAMVHGGVPADCLQCLCEASTKNCNLQETCHTSNTYYCGPFLITWNYWAVAGKPLNTYSDTEVKGAFEDCVNNYACAVSTINGYMAKNTKDCDGDGVITCLDYVRIHKYGENACGNPLTGDFKHRYEACASRFGK